MFTHLFSPSSHCYTLCSIHREEAISRSHASFWLKVFVHIPTQLSKKLDPKSQPGVFLGYSDESKGYRIWDLARQQVILSRDFIFYEYIYITLTTSSTPKSTTIVPIQEPFTTSKRRSLMKISNNINLSSPSTFDHIKPDFSNPHQILLATFIDSEDTSTSSRTYRDHSLHLSSVDATIHDLDSSDSNCHPHAQHNPKSQEQPSSLVVDLPSTRKPSNRFGYSQSDWRYATAKLCFNSTLCFDFTFCINFKFCIEFHSFDNFDRSRIINFSPSSSTTNVSGGACFPVLRTLEKCHARGVRFFVRQQYLGVN